jgi:hypothetical protein
MAIAASLSMPPGAMFSIMFTKHSILNFWRRQGEFQRGDANGFRNGMPEHCFRVGILRISSASGRPVTGAALWEKANDQSI